MGRIVAHVCERMTSTRLLQIVLGVILAVLVAAGLFTSAMIRDRQHSLQNLFRYDVAYTSSQAVIEFERLQSALLELEQSHTADALAEVQLRFEILYNRMQILDQGDYRRFVELSPQRSATVSQLREAVHDLDAIIPAADVDLNAGALLRITRPIERDLVGLASEANRYGSDLVAQDHYSLLKLHQRFASLTIGLVLCGLVLGGGVVWHNRLLVRANANVQRATGDLKRAAADLAQANAAVAKANDELRVQNRLLSEKEDALRAQNALFNAALNNMSQGLCMFDDDMRLMVFNTQFERLFHLRSIGDHGDDAPAQPLPSLRELMPDLVAEIEENIRRDRAATFETECYDGRIIAVSQQPMTERGWVATFEDVTDQRRAQARIAHMARHDGLTNLPNRYAFRERIQEALKECAESGSMLAVMCLDLDNFKEVNDTLGHPVGDALLCAAAERLAGCIRDTDMVARFGGDEFAILQPHIDRFDDAEGLAIRLVNEMRKPFLISGEFVYATASLGIAVAPKHGDDPDLLQKNADLALYAAKAEGRRTYRFFTSEMDERLTSRHVLERDLRQAIAAGEMELHYQPVVDLRTMKMTGLEALLRWTHSVHGVVPPSKFIPLAEEAGLIGDIGRWVLSEACTDATRWPPNLRVSINLSAAQFAHGDIVDDIRTALIRAGLRPDRLIVEITESLLLTESMSTLDTLHRLKALGIAIAMDDFGTGYSSLSYLRKYPFDRIKIDRSFLNSAGRPDQNTAIIRTIVQLGTALGMTTVAEGVETESDLEMLMAAGCAEGQGYLFSPPVPRDKVFDILSVHERKMSKVA
jgi:diguanylate cyclase (GGDEF)-like protein